jgi:hypothetical protein
MKSLRFCSSNAIVLALVLGVSACTSSESTAQLKEAGERGEQSYRLYRTGDYDTAKNAVLSYIQYLESKLADPKFVHVESSKSDIMTNYARLARLEQKYNGPDKDMYTQKAIAMCQQLKMKRNCTPLDLEAHVDAIDVMFPIR